MTTHQFNANCPPDELYTAGELKYLVVGNECRLLDKRRTPGTIAGIDMDGGFFRWEISDFEDKGKYWDVAFERANTFQFTRNAVELSPRELEEFEKRAQELDQIVEIAARGPEQANTNGAITKCLDTALTWLDGHSAFFNSLQALDFQNRSGPSFLRTDLNRYMAAFDLAEVETLTADTQVMNPHSGDWIRGMQIVMAEMGLKTYKGGQIRSSKAFTGLGSKENRRKYIVHRLGFIRAVFSKMALSEVTLYRGMSTDWDWRPDVERQYRFWSSWTFNYQVGKDFSELDPNSKQKHSYLIKRAIPVEKLFMTFLETDAMNRQYLEAEALVLHHEDDRMLW